MILAGENGNMGFVIIRASIGRHRCWMNEAASIVPIRKVHRKMGAGDKASGIGIIVNRRDHGVRSGHPLPNVNRQGLCVRIISGCCSIPGDRIIIDEPDLDPVKGLACLGRLKMEIVVRQYRTEGKLCRQKVCPAVCSYRSGIDHAFPGVSRFGVSVQLRGERALAVDCVEYGLGRGHTVANINR